MGWKEEGYSSMLLQVQRVHESPGDLVKSADFNSVGLGWGLRFRISNELLGDVKAMLQGPNFEEQGLEKLGQIL